ncbi:MAG: translation initiation factor IF-2 [Opitutae bacterium]|nr:translation initiation factor IF-2 [Opitutae bacterium]
MSIRIHELAKKIGIDNKELLSLLKERKFDVKSVSSTIDNISAEALVEELKSKYTAPAAEAAVEAVVSPAAEEPASVAKVKLPPGIFVKSKLDIEREKAEKAEKEQKEREAALPPVVMAKPVVAAPPPAPVSRPASPPTPPPIAKAPPAVSMPVSAPVAKAPPATPPIVRPASPPVSVRPAPVVPPAAPAAKPAAVVLPTPGLRPVAPPPAPAAPPAAPAPVVAPAPAPAPVVSAPPPVSTPPPVAPMAKSPAPVAAIPVSRPVPLPPIPPPLPPSAKPPALPGMAPAAGVTPAAPATPGVPGEVKILHFKPPVVVRDFATALGLKPFRLISELMEMGIFASMTQAIDETVAMKVAEKHGYLLEVKHRGEAVSPQQTAKDKEAEKKKKAAEDESKFLVTRPPIVCILGHVDHGKTSLLDALRKANVAAGEAGGITQHIGAYQIEHNGRKITFLDTPGHAAFNKMRARGASATDIAVLVVAADDGFMPQTDEALKHIQNAKVALMVAVNKMDVKGANLDQVKAQMQQRNIAPEDWGGETITVPVSAIKGTGLPELLEMILLQADVLELKANPKCEASGIVIESQLDIGRGPLATVIVQRGTLRTGDALICGQHWCKVRAMFDDKGATVKEAGPATPVRVIGWSGPPDSGAPFKAVKNAREAEKLAETEEQRLRKENAAAAVPKDISVASLFAEIAATQQKTLKVIVKTDVFGSSEAVRHVLDGIKSTKVQLEIVSIDVGLVTKNDVLMASTGGAVIVGFNTKLEPGVTPLAKHHNVRIETYEIIYELGDKVRDMMADLLDPDLKEVKLGAAEVRATFPLAKGFVAGCLVIEGKVNRNATARVRRGKENVYQGKVATLKRFKDDANEVRAGLECGIKLDDFNGYEIGDVIECFEIQKVRAAL